MRSWQDCQIKKMIALIDDATFYGIGANAIPAAAEKLDILAKTLCPKAG
jgi:hypothetical protein